MQIREKWKKPFKYSPVSTNRIGTPLLQEKEHKLCSEFSPHIPWYLVLVTIPPHLPTIILRMFIICSVDEGTSQWPLNLPELEEEPGLTALPRGLPSKHSSLHKPCFFKQLAFPIKTVAGFFFFFFFDLSQKRSQRKEDIVKQTNKNTAFLALCHEAEIWQLWCGWQRNASWWKANRSTALQKSRQAEFLVWIHKEALTHLWEPSISEFSPSQKTLANSRISQVSLGADSENVEVQLPQFTEEEKTSSSSPSASLILALPHK